MLLVEEADYNLLGRDLIVALSINLIVRNSQIMVSIYKLTCEDEDKINPEVWHTGKEAGKLVMEPISIEIERPEDPIRIRQYPIPLEGRQGLKPIIEDLIRKGILEPCMSRHNTPILAIKKADGNYRLQLTEGLHLKDDNWNFVSVDNSEQGTWPRVKGKLIVVGDCKHTPKEIEILPGTLDNNPGKFVLRLRCTHPPTFLPKGQIVAQIIPTWEHLEEDNIPTACPVHNITEVKPQVGCELQVGDEAINITGLLHTDMDVTEIPAKHWPSRWALENVAGHVQGIGGMQLAKQSKSVVQIKGPKGQLASLPPFVLDYREPLLGRDLMAQWGVTIDIPDPPQDFWAAVAEERPTHKLNWKTDAPVWVEQWPLSKQKLKALEELVEEQLAKGHIVETTSPWNSPVFVIWKPGKDKWRLLQDLRQINNVIEDMGSLQPGMPTPTMLPQNWKLAVIDIKDCFFHIPLHPDDAPCFAFSVPTVNREAPRKRYHWRVLPQGMKVSPIICQWYVASLLSPVRVAAEKAIIHHYMDDVLVCAPTDDVLSHALDLTINALVVSGFELQEDKVQRMPPWRYLGLEIGKRTIVPQKLEIKAKIQTLADVHQLCGALNGVRPWLGLTTEDLAPLFNLLKGGEELSSPRELTPEAKEALEKVLLTTEAAIRTKERRWIHTSRIKGPVEEPKEWTITSEPGDTKLTLKRGLGEEWDWNGGGRSVMLHWVPQSMLFFIQIVSIIFRGLFQHLLQLQSFLLRALLSRHDDMVDEGECVVAEIKLYNIL
ncbi:hypothetical protein DUI87_02133 [Hirundo rustica rustica]|uniref:ribonuclease H n=1 Tax=Hirundo rustica rustica TaxID=333673 RepID=A0A3M0L6G6_HIRRU|nr:hypothetical protein DUI87_02133 [Hirundo rustica rustica]